MARYTAADHELIGGFIDELHKFVSGERFPNTPQRARFVEVIRGGLQPEDDYQRAYLNWARDNPTVFKSLLPKKPRSGLRRSFDKAAGVSLSSRALSASAGSASSQTDREKAERQARAEKRKAEEAENARAKAALPEPKDGGRRNEEEFEKRYVQETWGSRDAWKKDKGSWRR